MHQGVLPKNCRTSYRCSKRKPLLLFSSSPLLLFSSSLLLFFSSSLLLFFSSSLLLFSASHPFQSFCLSFKLNRGIQAALINSSTSRHRRPRTAFQFSAL